MITAPEFEAFVADQVKATRARLDDKPTDLIPMLVVKTRDPTGKDGIVLAALAVPFNEYEEKRDALMTVGRRVFAERVVPLAITLSCEAWLAQQDEIPSGGMPRDSATKREAVILAAASMGRKFQSLTAIIVERDPENRMIAKEDIDYDKATKSAGAQILDHFFLGFAEGVLK